MAAIISVKDVSKVYETGERALNSVSLEIEQGEILALLGPNGAGKTTLISIICGLVNASGGSVTVAGHDIITDYRAARVQIGLVPQEISLEPFEKVINTLRFSRGLFGCKPDAAHLEKVLRALSLWDRRHSQITELSGGMKRRALIAKALSHEPRVLFLDEPTAGVDVELRKDMWQLLRDLRADGVTIILTTHHIEEAEEIADRVGVISKGEILLVEDKWDLMRKLGKKQMRIELHEPVQSLPEELTHYQLQRTLDGSCLIYTYDTQSARTGIAKLLADLSRHGIVLRDVQTSQSSLEDIFVDLVKESA